jgi:hypothetical protein
MLKERNVTTINPLGVGCWFGSFRSSEESTFIGRNLFQAEKMVHQHIYNSALQVHIMECVETK